MVSGGLLCDWLAPLLSVNGKAEWESDIFNLIMAVWSKEVSRQSQKRESQNILKSLTSQ